MFYYRLSFAGTDLFIAVLWTPLQPDTIIVEWIENSSTLRCVHLWSIAASVAAGHLCPLSPVTVGNVLYPGGDVLVYVSFICRQGDFPNACWLRQSCNSALVWYVAADTQEPSLIVFVSTLHSKAEWSISPLYPVDTTIIHDHIYSSSPKEVP